MDLSGSEDAAGGDVSEAHQGMHESQLPGIVQLQTRNPFAATKHGGLGELAQLTAVDKGLQDVLLYGEIIVADAHQLLMEFWEVLHGFLDPVVGDIIGGGLGAQAEMIAHVLLDEAISIVATNHRVGKLQILNHGLKFSLVVLGNFSAEDHGDLVGLADGAISIQ